LLAITNTPACCGGLSCTQPTRTGRSDITFAHPGGFGTLILRATKSIRRFCRHRPAESHPGRNWRGRSPGTRSPRQSPRARSDAPPALARELLKRVAHCRGAFGAGRSRTDRIHADALAAIFGRPRFRLHSRRGSLRSNRLEFHAVGAGPTSSDEHPGSSPGQALRMTR
jgi:hypothetical protein